MSAKGTIVLLVGFCAIGLFVTWVLVAPVQKQLVAIRVLALGVLIVTPTLMWWLFVASKRASLLNEFISDLERLGLLSCARMNEGPESEEGRRTRISSYLQKFEASYGPLRLKVHDDVRNGRLGPYSSEEASARQPLATLAPPIYLTVVVLAVGWLVTLPPIGTLPTGVAQPGLHFALTPNITPVTAAFMGAYFFSMQMLFRRYVRGDLRGSAYMAVSLRVILAVLGIWTVQAIAAAAKWEPDSQLIAVGFAVGVFPVIAWQIIRAAVSKPFQAALPTLESRLPLDNLDGLTVWHQSRLEEEDIENVPNMATADIVDLLVNTRFPAGRIVDWVDQSILLTAIGADEAKFRETQHKRAGEKNEPETMRQFLARYGIRTASSLVLATRPPEQVPWMKDGARDRRVRALARAVTTNTNLSLVLNWRRIASTP